MYQQRWGYKVEEKLYLEVREQKRLNTTGVLYEHEFRREKKKVKITKLSCYIDIAKKLYLRRKMLLFGCEICWGDF
jgi:hypothetical protein